MRRNYHTADDSLPLITIERVAHKDRRRERIERERNKRARRERFED